MPAGPPAPAAASGRAGWLIPAFILLTGAGLRFWGLGAGIPNDLNIDEPQIMSRSIQMMRSGSFNPHFFDYPGLYLHLQLGVACLRFLYGAIQGEWQTLDEIGMEDFFLWGRAVTALFGTATVALVYLAGRRWGMVEAVTAAALLAVMPGHVRESHFILTDTPTTFFVAATLVLALRAHETGRHRMFAAAGVLAGLAAATKYNGGLVIVVPLLVSLLSDAGSPDGVPMSRRLRLTSTTLVGAVGAFLLAAPYTILALPEFLNGFAHLAQAFQARPAHAESGAVIYLKHLRINLGVVGSVLAIAGLAFAAKDALRRWTRVPSLCVTVFPLAYLLVISDKSLIFGRYLLPMLPFVALVAGIGTARLSAAARQLVASKRLGYALTAALAVAALVQPARQAIGFDRGISVVGTPRLAYNWIAANVPRGASVAIEARALMLPTHRYRTRQFDRLSDRPPSEILACYDYVVASSVSYAEVLRDAAGHPGEYTAYGELFLKGTRVASFYPSPQHPGPELLVLRRGADIARPTKCP